MNTQHFDKAAAEWDQKKRRLALAKDIAEAIGRLPLTDNMNAMEYGCGTGLVGLALAPRLKTLTAVDTSTGMIDVLTEKIKESGIANVTPRLLDLTVETMDRRFDLIFSAMTLHHIEQTELILQRFYDHLLPGGILALADLDTEDGSFHSDGAGEKHHGFDRKALSSILTGFGFPAPAFTTVHTVLKETEDGGVRQYPVFLLTTRKSAC